MVFSQIKLQLTIIQLAPGSKGGPVELPLDTKFGSSLAQLVVPARPALPRAGHLVHPVQCWSRSALPHTVEEAPHLAESNRRTEPARSLLLGRTSWVEP